MTMVVEIVMFTAGVALYAGATKPRDAIGRWAFYALVGLLLGFFIADSFDASAPPSVQIIWISGLIASGVILVWAAWIERHRSSEGSPAT
jgi:hypothetical protein